MTHADKRAAAAASQLRAFVHRNKQSLITYVTHLRDLENAYDAASYSYKAYLRMQIEDQQLKIRTAIADLRICAAQLGRLSSKR